MSTKSFFEQNLNSSMSTMEPDAERSQKEPRRRFNLAVKLPLMIILMSLLAVLISTFLSVRAARAALIETLQDELTTQTQSKAELIRSNLVWTRGAAIDLAASAEVTQFDENGILKTLQNTLDHNEQIFGSAMAYEPYKFKPDLLYWAPYYSRTPTGELRFTQLGNSDYFKADWYRFAKERREPVLSPTYYAAGGADIWMVTWSAPFFDDNGEVKGVATADIAFSQTQQIVSSIEVGQTGYAFLLNRSGIIIGIGSHGGQYQVMEQSMEVAARDAHNTDWIRLVSSMTAGGSGFASAVDLQGQPVFIAYAPVELNTGWSLGLAYPQSELFQKAAPLQNTLIIYSTLIVLVSGLLLYLFTRSITEPLRRLTAHAHGLTAKQLRLVEGKLAEPIRIETRDELEDLAQAFNRMSLELAQSIENLEEKVDVRTRELERRSIEFETIAQVARDITSVRDLDTLLDLAVRLIRDRFGYYHVGIFLIDEQQQYAVLRAASSVAAKTMLEQRHKLRVGEAGIVGYVASTGLPRIALDVGTDAIHFRNPLLPETRSEIGLPLRSRTLTIGVLDIQAVEVSAFDQESVKILQLLADQLVSAIENAQLVYRSETTLKELGATYRSQTRQAWQKTIREQTYTALEYDGLQIKSVPHYLSASATKQLENGQAVIVNKSALTGDEDASLSVNTLLVPLMVLNQVIGVIGLERDDPEHMWAPEEIAIAEAAANRAALALENARLLQDAQRRAMKEQTIGEISAKIGNLVDLDNIVKTTIEELSRSMPDADVAIQFQKEFD